MTVEELILELSQYPMGHQVVIEVGGDGAIHSSSEIHLDVRTHAPAAIFLTSEAP